MATRLFFHVASSVLTNLPTEEQSSLTADINAEGSQTTNRQMNTTIGTSQTSLVSTVATGTNEHYYTRFVSPPLFQTSISANTWIYNFAASQNQSVANFPVNGIDKPVWVNCYVWRPGTGVVGTILDGDTASTVDEDQAGAGTAEKAHHVIFSGSAVASMQDNDVLIFEAWFIITGTAGRTGTFFYDGTTENVTDNATVSNHASFLETPENLVFTPPAPPVTNVRRPLNINTMKVMNVQSSARRNPIVIIGAHIKSLLEKTYRCLLYKKWASFLNPILARFRDRSSTSPVDSIVLRQI